MTSNYFERIMETVYFKQQNVLNYKLFIPRVIFFEHFLENFEIKRIYRLMEPLLCSSIYILQQDIIKMLPVENCPTKFNSYHFKEQFTRVILDFKVPTVTYY